VGVGGIGTANLQALGIHDMNRRPQKFGVELRENRREKNILFHLLSPYFFVVRDA
jgi:hypothetical protein